MWGDITKFHVEPYLAEITWKALVFTGLWFCLCGCYMNGCHQFLCLLIHCSWSIGNSAFIKFLSRQSKWYVIWQPCVAQVELGFLFNFSDRFLVCSQEVNQGHNYLKAVTSWVFFCFSPIYYHVLFMSLTTIFPHKVSYVSIPLYSTVEKFMKNTSQ